MQYGLCLQYLPHFSAIRSRIFEHLKRPMSVAGPIVENNGTQCFPNTLYTVILPVTLYACTRTD